ncbi:MAG: BACON domain-containing protein [bacterium]|nr:BACON domain-containing protein [bacterium]
MKRILLLIILSGIFVFNSLHSEEIPKPTYDNSVIFSWTMNFLQESTAEINYIKSRFGNGLYAPLTFSAFYNVPMAWNINPSGSSSGISSFKSDVDDIITFAKQHKAGMHLTLLYGLSRGVHLYEDAKIEDIRSAQWYNDNNISAQSQQSRAANAAEGESIENQTGSFNLDHTRNPAINSPDSPTASSSVINKYVFASFSRYARKLRAHLEAKIASTMAYLKQQQDDNPDIPIIVSAPGESELNFYRLNSGTLQNYFCDYSPFAILEFRDWLQHTGLYATGQAYSSDGYSSGGSKYQGASGLTQFNSDFGTSFTTWDLKYYNWSLSDTVDTDYTDGTDPDTHAIPVSQYTYDGMMPGSGSNYISGGFDPPRVMQNKGANAFYDLWRTFLENMVYHYVKDMAQIAKDAGFPITQYFTHQIPSDHLFGTTPTGGTLNNRFYSSASPMWTAKNDTGAGLGITLYDIKYPTFFARTSLYGIDAAKALSSNWAALEYHPEVIPPSQSSTISAVSTIYNQMIKLYNGTPHVISFFKWRDSTEGTITYRYKGNNRETAAKQFFDAIKDKARKTISTVFTPKKVEGFGGSYNNGIIKLTWSSKIWTDLTHAWTHWGDFKTFVIYRGYTSDFALNGASEIKRTTSSSFSDTGFNYNTTVYYKIVALNVNDQAGPVQSVSIVTPDGVPIPTLNVSRDQMNFAYISGGNMPPTQDYSISNTGSGALNWAAADDASWLSCNPDSGLNGALVNVSVDPTGLAVGSYTGSITISDPQAVDSPHSITVNLTVKNASQEEPPFGSFDTPVDGSTGMSSIPVTGWVLDDTGVESVKLYRDPVTNEGTSQIYVGDAIFVEGARPDVELAYPTYPENYKSGWGYMMLTHFLPAGGNGTYTFHIKAKDTSGNEVTLGSKTITIDNNSAVKPFGAIDTPTQGGIASGGSFVNWGWALTPQPGMIPIDGSTIKVMVNSVTIGNPTYNIFRSDIANFFPTYANSSGAIGYFIIDTTAYTDGIHTIQWLAADNNGNTDGIGSRFFTVRNSGSDTQSAAASHPGATIARQWAFGITNRTLATIPLAHSRTIRVRKGIGAGAKAGTLAAGKDGIIKVETRELERVVISPAVQTPNTRWAAVQLVGDRVRELPAGSTFDPVSGTLYWLPPHGFSGEYTFAFIAGSSLDNGMKPALIKIKLKINPRFGTPTRASK